MPGRVEIGTSSMRSTESPGPATPVDARSRSTTTRTASTTKSYFFKKTQYPCGAAYFLSMRRGRCNWRGTAADERPPEVGARDALTKSTNWADFLQMRSSRLVEVVKGATYWAARPITRSVDF